MTEAASPTLAEVQRLLRRLITAPSGVRPALEGEGDPDGTALATVIHGDARLSAVERLDVYANAYFFRILEVLQKDYPALEASVGYDRFHNLITTYLAAHPPTCFSLRYAGERLAAFIAHHADAAAVRDEFPWAADLAALDWAIVDAFDAEDVPPLGRENLARIPPDRWGDLRFTLDPSVRLLRARWPVNRIREASDAERPLPSIAAAETALCVWRRDERVFHRSLDPLEAHCLERLSGGATFGTLCERVALAIGESETPARALALLTGWIEGGLLSSLS